MSLSDAIQILTTLALFVGIYFTYKRLAPDIGAVKASTAQDNAETDSIRIGNDRTVYQAYKELLDDMAGVMRKQTTLEAQVAALEGKLSTALAQATEAEARAEDAEARFKALEEKTRDYPHRLELAEAEINSLKAIIVQKDVQAGQVSATRLADAQTRKSVADTALIAAGGTPIVTTPPSVDKDETATTPTQDAAKTAIEAVAVAIDEAKKPPTE